MNVPSHHTLAALRRGDLAGSRELRLAGVPGGFPAEIFGLADTLEVLDLSGCDLDTLPDEFGRLGRLRVLFCSGNRFARLPPVLGDCASLSQIGFRATGMREVPGEALPPRLRWLTLTDNRIDRMPAALGVLPHLQKLMLAGNRLRDLPATLEGAPNLELVRVAANGFDRLPPWLAELPSLAWLAFAANPFEPPPTPRTSRAVPWTELALGEQLGEGASGRIFRASWRPGANDEARSVAVKLFKGAMTSDGLPEREMAACLAAGEHPNLTGSLGRVVGHPAGAEGLLMPLLPTSWHALAGPPSLSSCSRDIYDEGLRPTPSQVRELAASAASAAAHLHARGLLHGDLYAHNLLWDRGSGRDAVLSDFGAASSLPPGEHGLALQRVEVRALGILLGELLSRCDEPGADLQHLQLSCVQPEVRQRPLMADVVSRLAVT